jgi:hypothetical protein
MMYFLIVSCHYLLWILGSTDTWGMVFRPPSPHFSFLNKKKIKICPAMSHQMTNLFIYLKNKKRVMGDGCLSPTYHFPNFGL